MFGLISIFFFSSGFAAIAPELVITGKRLRGDHRSARVYTETELARESGRSIGQILREAGGVDYQTGTGGNSNLLIRGASGSQTLVLIDGIKANDPSATNRYFDWSRIDASQIERVEILKGPQAVSYGSDAIGGVVLITTKRGEARPGATAVAASLEGGSEAFVRARSSLETDLGSSAGGEHHFGFQAFGKGIFDGGSAALSPSGGTAEGDDSREASVGVSLGSRWGRTTRSKVTADLRAAREAIDAGAFDDDPNSVARNREIRGSAVVDGEIDAGLGWGALASHLDFRRAYSDLPDSAHPSVASDTVLYGANSRGEFHFRNQADAPLEWMTGFEANRETLRIDSLLFPTPLAKDHAENYGIFAESALSVTEGIRVDAGARYTHFTSYGNEWSGKGGIHFEVCDRFEIDGGVSTGFKAPSLYSLYDPTYGNPALRPERALQAELGFLARPVSFANFSARGFESRIENRFGFDPATFRSLNIREARIRGVELESELTVSRGFRFLPSVTYLSTRDLATGRELNDVPRWKGALKAAYDLARGDSFTLSFLAKTDRGTSAGNTRTPGFARIDFSSRHPLGSGWTLFTRIENALDRDYQEVRGYRSPGISGYLGAEFASL